ncbi:hypothetical protein K7C98_08355 [Nannocystis pusilla]|uniref:Lipoprotein n=1 Tax=Nannocystis pusilla TaxID=889268 RepID=A0ABS7TM53_9BACT|nr:hypothetical protein [Nannocystis pusilla]MBZ5709271.1 hypothetical protein [Nannocystis pusilla]
MDFGNQIDTDACLPNCEPASCGDGLVHAGVEECDDGNGDDADACTNACSKNTCGDGHRRRPDQRVAGEPAVDRSAAHADLP